MDEMRIGPNVCDMCGLLDKFVLNLVVMVYLGIG